ncbi:hypothetical protein AMECASPLE_000832 [Ameca splendens]|uniref:Uncharacterized protein n=1 Tax=Ameca splendens TaxID=208324 RepID=A0ABV0ZWH9_9TELE
MLRFSSDCEIAEITAVFLYTYKLLSHLGGHMTVLHSQLGGKTPPPEQISIALEKLLYLRVCAHANFFFSKMYYYVWLIFQLDLLLCFFSCFLHVRKMESATKTVLL